MSVAGVVTGCGRSRRKRGDRMAVFMLEDEAAQGRGGRVPRGVRASTAALVVDDAMVLVRGKYERDEESSRLVVAEIAPLDVVRERAVRDGRDTIGRARPGRKT